MGNIGWSGIVIIAIIVVLLFGRGKISSIMADVAKGIKSFKKGMSDETDQTQGVTDQTQGETDQTQGLSSKDDSSEDSNSEKK